MDSGHALSRLYQITQNLDQSTLEDVTQLLECFNGSPIFIDGVSTTPFNDPVVAARLNARYSELTGEEHPNFLEQQPKVLENLLSRETFWLKNDVYTPMQMDLFRRLKENIDKSGPGVEIVCGGANHVLNRFDSIEVDPSQASLEDVTQLLNYFNGPSVLIDGVSSRPFNDPIIAATLNARYSELTGEEHPNFLEQQPKVLDNLLSNEELWLQNDSYTPMQMNLFRGLKENIDKSGPGIEVVCGGENHVLNRFDSIVADSRHASLEDVTQLLNYFNGPSVLIDGVSSRPFNDPIIAAMLNGRYSEFTDDNHPNYMIQQPKVLDMLLKQESLLIGTGAYTESDFNTFRTMRDNLARHMEGNDIKKSKIATFFNGIKRIGKRFGLIKSEVASSGRQLQEIDQAPVVEQAQDIDAPEI